MDIKTVTEAKTLGEVLRFQAATRPDATAFLFEDRRTDYATFDRHASQVAQGLLAEGCGHGARIAFLDNNSDLFYELIFGCAKAGAVSVGINWRLAPPEVAYVVNDSAAEVLFVGPDFYGLVEAIEGELKTVKTIIAMVPGHERWGSFEAWRDGQSAEDPHCSVTAEDIAIQMYTSGTTGHPKGVQLAHEAFLAIRRLPAHDDMAWDHWSEADVSLVAMPSFHIGGAGWGVQGVWAGAKNIVLSEFEPGRVLEVIEQERITKLFIVPAAMRLCLPIQLS